MFGENDFSRLELSLPDCESNYRYFRNLLKPTTKLLVLVKANAYGHGAVEFSRLMEQNGVEYFFLSPEEFKAKIEADEFLEYEEVYQDRFYGTLKSQVENQLAKGESVIFDVDVKGGVNIKKFYGERALSIFVQPPSVEELRRRLVGRNTDAPEVIEQRLAKASYELTFAPQFDHVVVNDDLEKAQQEVYQLVKAFLDAE